MVAYIRDIFISKPVMDLSLFEPLTLDISKSVYEVIDILRLNKIGCLLITDEMGLICGIVSERDIVRKVLAENRNLNKTLVSDIMTTNVKSIKNSGSIGKAIFYMQVEDVRHLPIVQNQSNPLGIISAKDIIDYLSKVLSKTNKRFNHVKNSEVTNFLKSPVSTLNNNQVITVESSLSAKKAMQLMKNNNIGSLLVTNSKSELAGIITERDFLFKPESIDDIYKIENISEIYTKYPVCISEDETVETALELMSDKKVRHLPILNNDAKLCGILSVRDLMRCIGEGIVEDL